MEEVKQKCGGVQLQNEDVYMATTFQSFIQMFVRRLRGEDQEEELVIDYATKDVNNMTVKMPYQCFINGKFENAEDGKTYNTVNPTDGSVSSVVSNTQTHPYYSNGCVVFSGDLQGVICVSGRCGQSG